MPGRKEIGFEKQKRMFFSTILMNKGKCRSSPAGMVGRLLRTFGAGGLDRRSAGLDMAINLLYLQIVSRMRRR
jgi:hypothetical protein